MVDEGWNVMSPVTGTALISVSCMTVMRVSGDIGGAGTMLRSSRVRRTVSWNCC